MEVDYQYLLVCLQMVVIHSLTKETFKILAIQVFPLLLLGILYVMTLCHMQFRLPLYTYMVLLERKGKLDAVTYWSAETFWYFVVGVWPLIYWQVYL